MKRVKNDLMNNKLNGMALCLLGLGTVLMGGDRRLHAQNIVPAPNTDRYLRPKIVRVQDDGRVYYQKITLNNDSLLLSEQGNTLNCYGDWVDYEVSQDENRHMVQFGFRLYTRPQKRIRAAQGGLVNRTSFQGELARSGLAQSRLAQRELGQRENSLLPDSTYYQDLNGDSTLDTMIQEGPGFQRTYIFYKYTWVEVDNSKLSFAVRRRVFSARQKTTYVFGQDGWETEEDIKTKRSKLERLPDIITFKITPDMPFPGTQAIGVQTTEQATEDAVRPQLVFSREYGLAKYQWISLKNTSLRLSEWERKLTCADDLAEYKVSWDKNGHLDSFDITLHAGVERSFDTAPRPLNFPDPSTSPAVSNVLPPQSSPAAPAPATSAPKPPRFTSSLGLLQRNGNGVAVQSASMTPRFYTTRYADFDGDSILDIMDESGPVRSGRYDTRILYKDAWVPVRHYKIKMDYKYSYQTESAYVWMGHRWMKF